jgi:hypothetical protein
MVHERNPKSQIPNKLQKTNIETDFQNFNAVVDWNKKQFRQKITLDFSVSLEYLE